MVEKSQKRLAFMIVSDFFDFGKRRFSVPPPRFSTGFCKAFGVMIVSTLMFRNIREIFDNFEKRTRKNQCKKIHFCMSSTFEPKIKKGDQDGENILLGLTYVNAAPPK